MTGEQQRAHLYTCTKPSNHEGACDDVARGSPGRAANPCYPSSTVKVMYHPLDHSCPNCGHLVALHSAERACAACELLTIGPAKP